MKISIIIVLGIGGSLLLRMLFHRRESRFEHLALLDIQRYLAYAAKTLADGGRIVIIPENVDGSVLVRKRKNSAHVRTLVMELTHGAWSENILIMLAEKLEALHIQHTLAYTKHGRVLTIAFDPDDPLTPSAASHVLGMICTLHERPVPLSFTLYCWGPFLRGYVPEDGEVIPASRAHTAGYAFGRFIGSLFLVRRLVDGIRFGAHVVTYRRFQRVCKDSRKSLYFAYSEPHQWEHFLGPEGSLAPVAEHVYCANWREHWEAWKRHPKRGRGTEFDRFVGHTWHITNMQRDLPFVIVFTREFKPVPVFFNEAYAQRKRDAAQALQHREQEMLEIIEKQGMHITKRSRPTESHKKEDAR